MPVTVVDDHLLRDVLAGSRPPDLDGVAPDGIATTGMWLFRLCSSFADPAVVGKLSAPLASLPEKLQAEFRARLVALPADVEILPLREIAWSMAVLQKRHRAERRPLSAAMVEALAAAHRFGGGIAVSRNDVGPNLRAASESDGLASTSCELVSILPVRPKSSIPGPPRARYRAPHDGTWRAGLRRQHADLLGRAFWDNRLTSERYPTRRSGAPPARTSSPAMARSVTPPPNYKRPARTHR